MANRLGIYNGALAELGERKLASLTEAREPRRVLDDRYDQAVADCLEAGQWHFAMRSIEVESNPAIDPDFGYIYAFDKPTDWVRTCAFSGDETFSTPLLRYIDETDYWQADTDPLYVKYVSNDTEFGMDLARWPSSFARYVEVSLALMVCERLTQNTAKFDRLEQRIVPRARRNALNKDASAGAQPRFAPMGTWAQARLGGGKRYDRA